MQRNLRKVEVFRFGDESEVTQIKTKAKKDEEKKINNHPTIAVKEEFVQIQKPSSAPKQKFNVRFDYAAGLCKDFLETGYCGFGDSCIFLHDRGDYKMGWELDADFARHQQQAPIDTSYEIPEAVDPSLTECPVCKSAHEKPRMLPECGHRFCSSCIVNALKTKLKCPLCKAIVSGTLKPIPNH